MGRLGEFGKTGELGEPEKLGTESGAERRARFLRGEEGAVMRDMRVRSHHRRPLPKKFPPIRGFFDIINE